MKTLTRALFLKSVMPVVGTAMLVLGCGDDDDDTPGGTGGASGTGGTSGGKCASGTVAPVIGTNHGHDLTVPLADVMAGVTKSYLLTTGNNHTHMVEITAENFTALKAAGTVSGLVSITDATNHTHTVMLTCSA
jgi:hypothetical protein